MTPERFTIRPCNPGADLRDPDTGDRLPPEGAEKARNAYWLGLVLRGDAEEVPAKVAAPIPAETRPAKKADIPAR